LKAKERKKNLNQSIVSKIYKSAVVHYNKRDSTSGSSTKEHAPRTEGDSVSPSTEGSLYQKWNPSTPLSTEESSKPSTTESHAYSIWNAKAVTGDDRGGTGGGDTGVGGYNQMPTRSTGGSSGSLYSSFSAETSNPYGVLTDRPQGGKS